MNKINIDYFQLTKRRFPDLTKLGFSRMHHYEDLTPETLPEEVYAMVFIYFFISILSSTYAIIIQSFKKVDAAIFNEKSTRKN